MTHGSAIWGGDPSRRRTAAWDRLAWAGRWLILLAAGIAVAVLVVALVTDRAHEEAQARTRLELTTQARAHSLALHLGVLGRELNRLGLHSNIDLLDESLEPERTLLRLAHGQSAFFGVGVALLDARGQVAWSEPRSFLAGEDLRSEGWFRQVQRRPGVHLTPVRPERDDALLYVVVPVIRQGVFTGALVGGIDLAAEETLTSSAAYSDANAVLTTSEGTVIYPATPPAWEASAGWRDHFEQQGLRSWTEELELGGRARVVASTAVPSTDLVLSSMADAAALYGPARSRMHTRLGIGLSLVLLPVVVLLLLQHRSLERYRRREAIAVRQERLAHLGAAANVIAHEVKNSLNGVRLGMDLMLQSRGDAPQRVIEGMRTELGRLAEFATELLLFARGIELRPEATDLQEIVHRAVEVAGPIAEDRGIELQVRAPVALPLRADPALLQVVVSNLLTNAIDAASSVDADRPVVRIAARAEGDRLHLTVWDEGPGVPAPVRDHLFEPFVTGKPSGIGIGLAISHRIVELHGGALRLEPGDGRGTTFSVRLPMGRS